MLTKLSQDCIIISANKFIETKFQKPAKRSEKMKYYASIDIGGSKTKIYVFSQDDVLVEEFKTLGVGKAVDSDEDIPFLSKLLSEIALKYKVETVAINLGGKNTNQIKTIVERAFTGADVTVVRESDGTASIEFGKLYGSNIVLLAGTGTIAISYDDGGNYVVSGGWGANIGDGGSGYSIGLAAIKSSLLALDKNEELLGFQKEITGLETSLPKVKNVSDVRDMRDAVRAKLAPLDRGNIASFAKVLEKYALKGEKDAIDIFKTAGREMAELIVDSYNKLLPFKTKSVAVSGGLVNIKSLWQTEFEEYIKSKTEIDNFVYNSDGVMLGAQTIAKNNFLKKGDK